MANRQTFINICSRNIAEKYAYIEYKNDNVSEQQMTEISKNMIATPEKIRALKIEKFNKLEMEMSEQIPGID